MTAQFVNTLVSALVEGARVYCCSDVRPLAAEMQRCSGQGGCVCVGRYTFARCGEMKDALAESDFLGEKRRGDGGWRVRARVPRASVPVAGAEPSGAERMRRRRRRVRF